MTPKGCRPERAQLAKDPDSVDVKRPRCRLLLVTHRQILLFFAVMPTALRHNHTRGFAIVPVLLLVAAAAQQKSAPSYNFVIRHAHIIDGTGNPWFAGDIAIKGERIAAVGHVTGKGAREIEASGMVAAPGFIDMHTHSDLPLLVNGNAESKIRQGVTTEILGETASVAPQCPNAFPSQTALPGGADQENRFHIKIDWSDFEGYFARLRQQGTSVNVASYVGA